MPRRNLIVYSLDLNTMKKTPMAEFKLKGDKVEANFTNKTFEREVGKGIRTGKGVVRFDEGEAFLKALENAYRRSSTVIVENG